jgi:hypothetical protein
MFCGIIAFICVAGIGASLPHAAGRVRWVSSLQRIAPDHFRIVKLSPDGERSGARLGDVLDTTALTLEQRMRFWNGAAAAGATIPVLLFRSGKPVIVQAHAPPLDSQAYIAIAISFALVCIAILAGLLLMLRGDGKASFVAGLALLTLGLTLQRADHGAAPWIGPVWFEAALFEIVLWSAPAFAVSAFVLGMILLRDHVARPVRIALMLTATAAILTETAAWSADYGQWIFTGHTFGGQYIYPYAAVAWISVTILTFALAAARTHGDNAAAVRTLFVATLIGLADIAASYLADFGFVPRPPAMVNAACALVLFAGYFYAFFARRLVALDFVINRAAVFAILAAVIAGVVAIVEKLVETFALGRESGFAFEVASTLIVALSFRWLERRISAAVERVFYRDKLRAAEALEALPEDFPLLRERSILANHLVREVQRQLRVPFTVLYIAQGQEYVAEGAAGIDPIAVLPVADTDPAIVRLRSRHDAIDCHEFQSRLGSDGYAFPLTVLGRVTGCLYVSARPNGEGLDPDERSIIARLAREAATAMLWMTEHQPQSQMS